MRAVNLKTIFSIFLIFLFILHLILFVVFDVEKLQEVAIKLILDIHTAQEIVGNDVEAADAATTDPGHDDSCR